MRERKNNILTASELAYILGVGTETIKNKLDNYQLTKYTHRDGKNPCYAITLCPKSVELIKKIVIPKNRRQRAERCLERFNKWLKTGEVE